MLTLYRGNSQVVTLPSVRSAITQALISDAVIVASILDPTGVVVPSYDSISMAPVAATPGSYSFNISETFTPRSAAGYTIVFSGTASAGDYTITQRCEVDDRVDD